MHESDVVAVSVVCAVVLLVSLFLILASLSSLSPRSISILNTSVKVTCARVLSIIVSERLNIFYSSHNRVTVD